MDIPVMMDVDPDEAIRIEAAIDECFAAMKLANTKLATPTDFADSRRIHSQGKLRYAK